MCEWSKDSGKTPDGRTLLRPSELTPVFGSSAINPAAIFPAQRALHTAHWAKIADRSCR
jgi:hypothetical protein